MVHYNAWRVKLFAILRAKSLVLVKIVLPKQNYLFGIQQKNNLLQFCNLLLYQGFCFWCNQTALPIFMFIMKRLSELIET